MSETNKTIGVFYHKRFIEEAKEQGNNLIVLPQVLKQKTELKKDFVASLLDFDWLVFTDVFAVDFFIEYLEESSFEMFELDNLRVCAFGEAVADRLRFVQIHSDVIASSFEDEKIFQQIEDYIFQENEFSELKFLIINAKDREIYLESFLSAVEANVSELEIYQTDFAENITKIKTLAKGGAFDEIICFSPDEVFDIAMIFNNEDLSEIFTDVTLLAKSEVTFQTLRELGMNPKLSI